MSGIDSIGSSCPTHYSDVGDDDSGTVTNPNAPPDPRDYMPPPIRGPEYVICGWHLGPVAHTSQGPLIDVHSVRQPLA